MKKFTNPEVVSLLRKVRRLLAKGWTQKTFARNKWGNSVSFFSKSACKFCLGGAIRRVAVPSGKDTAQEYIVFNRLRTIIGNAVPSDAGLHYSIVMFNDMQPHTQQGKANVLRVLDVLIKKFSK